MSGVAQNNTLPVKIAEAADATEAAVAMREPDSDKFFRSTIIYSSKKNLQNLGKQVLNELNCKNPIIALTLEEC